MTTDYATNPQDPSKSQEMPYLLTDQSFKLLRQAQQAIKEKTDMIPSIRKMINALITEQAMMKLTQEMIDLYRD